jgi:hypothetical protein
MALGTTNLVGQVAGLQGRLIRDGEIKDELGIAVVGPPTSVFARNVRRGGNTFENQPTRQRCQQQENQFQNRRLRPCLVHSV